MHAMLQQDTPEDFVIAAGVLRFVKYFLNQAFFVMGLDFESHTHINSDHFRPGEVAPLCGDSSKARRILNWNPTRTFEQIIEEIVLADIEYPGKN